PTCGDGQGSVRLPPAATAHTATGQEEGMAGNDNATRRIGFIGLGNMGAPIAANLVKAGHQVDGFDLSAAACDQAKGQGVRIAASASAAVAEADVVISVLPASRHVAALYLGDGGNDGLLGQIRAGALVIDCSTIAAATSQQVAKAAADRGLQM